MNELHATNVTPYQVALMSVINVLLLGEEDLRKRGFLRQEFMGAGVIVTLTAKTPRHLGQNFG